ncbi:MAG: hypothetical protein AB1641_19235 [Thermodesulfobacteriota bacterium]
MRDEEKKPKDQFKVRQPGKWPVLDVLLGLLGIAALIALAIAGFIAAKWVAANYF